MKFDAIDFFNTVKPGYFESEHIRQLPPEEIYEEQLLELSAFSPADLVIECPENITFGIYEGEMEPLIEAVRSVEEGWVNCYHPGDTIYCAFDGDRIVSFCLIEDFGTYNSLTVGGPGCVGTIPEYRMQGIGLKMVQNVTEILRQRGCDLSFIHYTGVGHWYAKLGYRTLFKWNCNGIIK